MQFLIEFLFYFGIYYVAILFVRYCVMVFIKGHSHDKVVTEINKYGLFFKIPIRRKDSGDNKVS